VSTCAAVHVSVGALGVWTSILHHPWSSTATSVNRTASAEKTRAAPQCSHHCVPDVEEEQLDESTRPKRCEPGVVMPSLEDLEARLRAIEDDVEIRNLAAKFTDCVNERNVDGFPQLWASKGPVWEIGPPLASRAEGVEDIVAMLRHLLRIQRYFMQMTHSGVVTVDRDRATARFVVREHGRGDTSYYDNLAIYEDSLLRESGGWRFAERHYRYRFLDQDPFAGKAFPVR
jgi:hypothetical protein